MIIVRTPFRISYFGGGTDFPEWYKNFYEGGMTLCAAIDKYCYINIRYLNDYYDHKYRIRYYKNEEKNKIDLIKHPCVREVLKKYGKSNLGYEIIHNADIPARTGLGSSSAFTVSLINAIHKLRKISINKTDLWNKAINLEQRILKEAVGSQDQIITTIGGFNLIKFKKNNIKIKQYPKNNININALKDNISLFFLGFGRDAKKIEKDKIRRLQDKKKNYFDLYKICEEATNIISGNNFNITEIASLLNEQWKIKKALSTFVSNQKINNLYDYALRSGALGGKILGAGGGGFFLFLSRNRFEKKKLISNLLKFQHINFNYDYEGSKVVYETK